MKKSKPIKDSINIIKENWKKIGLILIFDLLFILLIYNLGFVAANVNGWLFIQFYRLGGMMLPAAVFSLIFVESLILIGIYSFFKYLVLGNIYELFKKSELKFNRFFSFLKLNWIASLPIILLYAAAFVLVMYYIGGLITEGISNPFSFLFNVFIIFIIILILSIYLYTWLNLMHNLFLKEKDLWRIIKQSLKKSLKLKTYRIYWSNLKIIFAFLIALLLFEGFMKLFILTNVSAYLKYGGIYKTGLTAITILTAYFLLLFNRINFYQNIMKNKR